MVAAGAISAGAPGVMKPVCMSITRWAVRLGSMLSKSRKRPRLPRAIFTTSSSSFTVCTRLSRRYAKVTIELEAIPRMLDCIVH